MSGALCCLLVPSVAFRSRVLGISLRRWLHRNCPPPGKPPCLPPSKTKRYKVVHVDWQPAEHVQELLWRRHAYMDSLASLRQRFREEQLQKEETGETAEKIAAQEKLQFKDRLEKNLAENQRLAALREEREREQMKMLEHSSIERSQNYLEKQARQLVEREQMVQEMITKSKHFVNADNVAEKVAEALEKPVDLNFCIDADGNMYAGTPMAPYAEQMPTNSRQTFYRRKAAANLIGKLKNSAAGRS